MGDKHPATMGSALPSKEQVAVRKLAAELFRSVETAQGYAFVSDGEDFPTLEQFWDRIRGRHAWAIKAADRMREFLQKHGEYR